jgi:hypothetical protein
MNRRTKIALTVGSVGIATLVIASCSTGQNSGPSQKPSHNSKTPTNAPHKTSSPKPKTASHPPTKDITSLYITSKDDGYGFKEVTAHYTIVNHSSKASDYQFTADVVNSSGKRVSQLNEFENNVKPGQTVNGTDPLLPDSAFGAHVKNLQVQRTATVN